MKLKGVPKITTLFSAAFRQYLAKTGVCILFFSRQESSYSGLADVEIMPVTLHLMAKGGHTLHVFL